MKFNFKRIFDPTVNFINSLKFYQKFGITISLVMILFVITVYLLFSEINKWIAFTDKEYVGVEYIMAINYLIKDIQEHRGLANAYLSGLTVFSQELINKENDIKKSIQKVDDIEYKQKEFLTNNPKWSNIKVRILDLKKIKLLVPPKESFKQHTSVIKKLLTLVKDIGDESNLILDPALDTYYLADSILHKVPILNEEMAQIRGRNLGIIEKQYGRLEEQKAILSDLPIIMLMLDQVNSNYLKASQKNQLIKKKLNNKINKTNANTKEFINLISTHLLTEKFSKVDPQNAFKQLSIAINGNYEMLFEMSMLLKTLFSDRINDYNSVKYFITIITGIIFLIIAYLYVGFFISIKDSFKKLKDASNKIAKGEFTTRVNLHTKDELNELGWNLNIMAEKLQELFRKETIIKEVLMDISQFETQSDLYTFVLERAIAAYNANRIMYLHYNTYKDLVVSNEVIKNGHYEPLIDQTIFSSEYIAKCFKEKMEDVCIVNDVDKDILDEKIKNKLLAHNIKSFIIYPITVQYPSIKSKDILGFTMITSGSTRVWQEHEAEFFKILNDAISIIYVEIIDKKKREEMKSTFIATLTHDLRSPINAEQKALEYILSRNSSTTLSNYLEYLTDMYNTNEELLRIVDNILTIYHYESGKLELKTKPEDIKQILNTAVKSTDFLAKSEESEIIINIPDTLPEIYINSDAIYRVIINLLSNSIKHNKKGTSIKLAAKKAGDEIQISVSDNGRGIPEQERQHIFQRFPTAKRAIGTGLGLYISKVIIEQHKGRIWFDTIVGKGTTFYFTLPLV